jgi:NAD(P)-dependent dehydrogenase (short-subunit alcohol dehydrogenase family)
MATSTSVIEHYRLGELTNSTGVSELKDRRIRVNVLTPGQVATPGQEQMFDDEGRDEGVRH